MRGAKIHAADIHIADFQHAQQEGEQKRLFVLQVQDGLDFRIFLGDGPDEVAAEYAAHEVSL